VEAVALVGLVLGRGENECASERGKTRVLPGLNTGREEGRGRGKAPTALTCHSWPAVVPDLGGKKGGNGKGVKGIVLWGFISLNWSAGMEGEAREHGQARRSSRR
jgi:hypothetical protein